MNTIKKIDWVEVMYVLIVIMVALILIISVLNMERDLTKVYECCCYIQNIKQIK